MTMTYSYENAKKSFDSVFEQASIEGKVEIRKDDQLYVLTTVSKKTSPLDIDGVNMGITTQDILSFIHESRRP